MKRPVLAFACAACLLASVAWADPEETRSYVLEYRPVAEAAEAIGDWIGEEGSVSMRPRKKTLVVTDVAATHDRIAAFLEAFDVPPRTVDVSVSLMLASDRTRDEAGRRTPLSAVTAEVRGVMESVGDFTRWVDYEPLGTHAASTVEGRTTSVRLDDTYGVDYRVDGVETGPDGDRIRLSPFRLIRFRMGSDGVERQETVFETAMRLPVGRLQVLGAASGADADRALFLTVRAETTVSPTVRSD